MYYNEKKQQNELMRVFVPHKHKNLFIDIRGREGEREGGREGERERERERGRGAERERERERERDRRREGGGREREVGETQTRVCFFLLTNL